jgi:hypothetical protein
VKIPTKKVLHLAKQLFILAQGGFTAAERQALLIEVVELALYIAPAGELTHRVLMFLVTVLKQLPGGLTDDEIQALLADLFELAASIAPDELVLSPKPAA